MNEARPVVAVTLGDPASIGPEVVVKALAEEELGAVCVPVVVGDRRGGARAVAPSAVASRVGAVV